MGNADIRRKLTREYVKLQEQLRSIRDQFPKEECCSQPGCFEDAAWVRATQFSGEHYFCAEHAKLQSDFGQTDSSYFYWDIVADFKKDKAEVEKQMAAEYPTMATLLKKE